MIKNNDFDNKKLNNIDSRYNCITLLLAYT